jgi:hypothetical protein
MFHRLGHKNFIADDYRKLMGGIMYIIIVGAGKVGYHLGRLLID